MNGDSVLSHEQQGEACAWSQPGLNLEKRLRRGSPEESLLSKLLPFTTYNGQRHRTVPFPEETPMRKSWLLAGLMAASFGFVQPSVAQQPTIPIIVKDTTSFYWQIVLAGARKAGQDLNVKVQELGAQSEADITGQISIL